MNGSSSGLTRSKSVRFSDGYVPGKLRETSVVESSPSSSEPAPATDQNNIGGN